MAKPTYALINEAGEEVKIGETITSNSGEDFEFCGFSYGRIGPKLLVRAQGSRGFSREMFTTVFDQRYMVEEQ